MRKLAALVLALLLFLPAPAAWAEVTRAQLAEAEAKVRAKSAELEGRLGVHLMGIPISFAVGAQRTRNRSGTPRGLPDDDFPSAAGPTAHFLESGGIRGGPVSSCSRF